MCLDRELSQKQFNKIKSEAQRRGYIRVWKVCSEKRTGWCFVLEWKKGLRKAEYSERCDSGWYAYLSLEEAKQKMECWVFHYIKVCYAKPSWIKRLGKDGSFEVGVFTHLVFPDWAKGDMTIREFRAECRKEKP